MARHALLGGVRRTGKMHFWMFLQPIAKENEFAIISQFEWKSTVLLLSGCRACGSQSPWHGRPALRPTWRKRCAAATARRTGGVGLKGAALPLPLSRKTVVVTSNASVRNAATTLAMNDVEVASHLSFQPIHFCPPLSLSRC